MPKILVEVTEERLTAAAASWIELALFDGAVAVDATVGNGYDTLFLAHRVGPRGKVLGGSSSINAMMWVRGMRADYDHWAELAGPSWSYDAVLPYFTRAESTEGASDKGGEARADPARGAGCGQASQGDG